MADYDIHRELFIASEAGDNTRVTELLGTGADPDKYRDIYGLNALIWAANLGRDNIVSILIQHGADLNIQNEDGKTALYKAAENGKNQITTALIEAGADLHIQDNDGKTIFLQYSNPIVRLNVNILFETDII